MAPGLVSRYPKDVLALRGAGDVSYHPFYLVSCFLRFSRPGEQGLKFLSVARDLLAEAGAGPLQAIHFT